MKNASESRTLLGLAPHAATQLRSMDRLVGLFQRRSLPWELWSHRTQLVVALHYLLRYGFEQGVRHLRKRIREYNARLGVASDEDGGYHETAIVSMMWSLGQFRRRNALVRNRYVLMRRLWQDPVSDPDFLRRSYSEERLRSALARRQWVEPDRVRLPLDARRRIYAAAKRSRDSSGIPRGAP